MAPNFEKHDDYFEKSDGNFDLFYIFSEKSEFFWKVIVFGVIVFGEKWLYLAEKWLYLAEKWLYLAESDCIWREVIVFGGETPAKYNH